MAVAPSVTNVVLVRLKGTIGGQVWNNVFHVQYTGPAPQVVDLVTIGTAINNAWTTNILPLCSTSLTFGGCDLADLTNPAAAATSVSASGAGARTGVGLTAQAACVTSWLINVRYRGGHPRTYWPIGVVTDTQNVRLWAAAFVTSVNNASTAFRTALNALTHGSTTYKMCVVSYRSDNAPRPTPLVFTVQGNSVHGRIDTQRHRLGKETP